MIISYSRIKEMRGIIYLEGGGSVPVTLLSPIERKERETWRELERRFAEAFNASQPHMAHKVVRAKLFRN